MYTTITKTNIKLNVKTAALVWSTGIIFALAMGIALLPTSQNLNAGLNLSDTNSLTKYLENISSNWGADMTTIYGVDILALAGDIFNKQEYTSASWESYFNNFFQSHSLNNNLYEYLGYTSFSWTNESTQNKLQKSLTNSLLNKMMPENMASLKNLLSQESSRETIFNANKLLLSIVRESTDQSTKDYIFSRYITQIRNNQDYLSDKTSFNNGTDPYLAVFRTQIWMNLSDIADPLTPIKKTQIAQTLNLSPIKQSIWDRFSILIHDNGRLNSIQLQKIYELLSTIPQSFHNLRHITQSNYLGFENPYDMPTMTTNWSVNIFNTEIGEWGNSFSHDLSIIPSPRLTDVFITVLAHEVTHIIDGNLIEKNDQKKSRKDALIKQAGIVWKQYLRDATAFDKNGIPNDKPGEGTYFQKNPQEFIASIANEWFHSSKSTLDLAISRFVDGYKEPLNQVLFFVDLFSNNSSQSTFYAIDSSGNISTQMALITRNANGSIIGLNYAGAIYNFVSDTAGNVISYSKPNTATLFIDSPTQYATIQDGEGLINCGSSCSAEVPLNKTVVLQITATDKSIKKARWDAASCTKISNNNLNCEIKMTREQTAKVLTSEKSQIYFFGDNDILIKCKSNCERVTKEGAMTAKFVVNNYPVIFEIAPSSPNNSKVVAISGCDSVATNANTKTCRIDQPNKRKNEKYIMVATRLKSSALIEKHGNGTIQQLSGRELCKGMRACVEYFNSDKTIKLVAKPSKNFIFTRWGGNCKQRLQNICIVDLDPNNEKFIFATFQKK